MFQFLLGGGKAAAGAKAAGAKKVAASKAATAAKTKAATQGSSLLQGLQGEAAAGGIKEFNAKPPNSLAAKPQQQPNITYNEAPPAQEVDYAAPQLPQINMAQRLAIPQVNPNQFSQLLQYIQQLGGMR
jgi:hypothetical protein